MIVCTETVLIGRKCDPMEEKVKQQYDRWLSQPGMPADLADELNSIAGDEDAITDRFYWNSAPAVCGVSSAQAPTG